MKFTLQSVKNGCRLGLIESTQGVICKEETPMCMLYTRAGCVPNLTKDMFERIEKPPKLVHMSLPQLVDHYQTIDTFEKGIKGFTGWQDSLVYLSTQDPALPAPTGYNDKTSVSVWNRAGRVKLDAPLFTRIVKSLRVDAFQTLADTDTDSQSSEKRKMRAVDRSYEMAKQVMEAREKDKELSSTFVLGTLTGGWDKKWRSQCCKELVETDIQGVVFEGFYRGGEESEKFNVTDVQEVIQEVNLTLDSHPSLLRVWQGVMSPVNVLNAVQTGIDVCDSSYPAVVTERGCAMVFPYDRNMSRSTDKQTEGEICLSDKKYTSDLTPVLSDCTCYTCTHHTKAYISHLLNTSELLAGVLLNIHNFHHYLRFFEQIRRHLREETFTDFRNLVCAAYANKDV